MSFVEKVFEPLYGKIGWNVSKGVGSFLTFEFGEPHFSIVREPIPFRADITDKRKREQARRVVAICGDWHLWIYCCDWNFFLEDKLIGHENSTDDEINEIAMDLNGQALTSVKITSSNHTIFSFDLGARLETIPNVIDYSDKDKTEQWFLFEPTKNVLTFRADGYYSYHHEDETTNSEAWHPNE